MSSSSRKALPLMVPTNTGSHRVLLVSVPAMYPVAIAVPCHVPLEMVPTVTRELSPV